MQEPRPNLSAAGMPRRGHGPLDGPQGFHAEFVVNFEGFHYSLLFCSKQSERINVRGAPSRHNESCKRSPAE
jgi:hypothetical protein